MGKLARIAGWHMNWAMIFTLIHFFRGFVKLLRIIDVCRHNYK